MPDIATIIAQGAANPWLYLPFAILLGALHGLEPGHSKSMMAAFIVAARGTPGQAALLGVSAAIGHTIVVWVLAALGLYLGDKLILDRAEPWLVLISGLAILLVAARILWLFRRASAVAPHGGHGHHGDHDHGHHEHGPDEDAHARMHEREIQTAFAGKAVRQRDIVWFGLTGGLLPCPSAVAVVLICLQLKAFTLGFAMVAGFSLGLALTLIAVGVAAAWGADRLRRGWSGFEAISAWVPWLSAGLVAAIGLVITGRGLAMLLA